MRVIIQPDYGLASKWAAHYIAKKINDFGPTKTKPFLLGLPTGSSPLGMYKELIKLNSAKKVTFKNVITFNMDEYVGLSEDHPASYHYYICGTNFSTISISPPKTSTSSTATPKISKSNANAMRRK